MALLLGIGLVGGATAIGAHLKRHDYDDYPMILLASEVEVLRPEKI